MSSRRMKSMQCPECGSHYTQAISLAYSQSIRTGYNGNQSISEFGRGLEPPPPQSEVLIPLGLAAVMFVATFVFFPTDASWIGIDWVQRFLTSSWGRIAISTLAAFLVLVWSSGSAIAHNATEHASEMDDWERAVVCRRCGEQFSS